MYITEERRPEERLYAKKVMLNNVKIEKYNSRELTVFSAPGFGTKNGIREAKNLIQAATYRFSLLSFLTPWHECLYNLSAMLF